MRASNQYYKQDGTTYLLSVQRIGDKWIAKWLCTKCVMGGESSPKYDTEQAAFIAAKSNFQGHHLSYHKNIN